MKKLSILLFSILISFNSYGEWTKVAKGASDNTYIDSNYYYIDTDTIKEYEGYVFFWQLTDYPKSDEFGNMSDKAYVQGECGVNRFKFLSGITYKQPMGKGNIKPRSNPPDKWNYPPPDSVGGLLLKYVCDYVE